MATDRITFRRLAPLALATAVLFVGCGDRNAATAAGSIGGERFVRVNFDDIPRPEPRVFKEHRRKDKLQTESFDIAGAPPSNVLAYYVKALEADGWEQTDPVAAIRGGKQGQWSRFGRTLIVQAKDGTTTDPAKPAPTSVTLSFTRLARPGG